jgi:hypothetical protein
VAANKLVKVHRPIYARILGGGEIGPVAVIGIFLWVPTIIVAMREGLTIAPLLFGIFAAVFTALLVRGTLVGMALTETEVVIRNQLHTHVIDWKDVRAVSLSAAAAGRGQWAAPVFVLNDQKEIDARVSMWCLCRSRLRQLKQIAPFLTERNIKVTIANSSTGRARKKF